MPPELHFAKQAFALHFLLQDLHCLIDIVVAYENLQLISNLAEAENLPHDEVRSANVSSMRECRDTCLRQYHSTP